MKHKGITTISMVIIFVLLGVLVVSVVLRKHNERMHADSICYHRMKILGTLLEIYAEHNGYRFPSESEFSEEPLLWKKLVKSESGPLSINEDWFYCPLDNDYTSGSSYEFNVNLAGKDLRTLKGNQVILLRERRSPHNGTGNTIYLNLPANP